MFRGSMSLAEDGSKSTFFQGSMGPIARSKSVLLNSVFHLNTSNDYLRLPTQLLVHKEAGTTMQGRA